MSKNTRLGLVFTAVLGVMLVLVGCGGTGAAPINGGSLAKVAVSVAPSTMTVTTGTTQPFTATVTNTAEMGVGWLVNGYPGGVNPANGTTPFGTIDKNGNYTAPQYIPAPPTVTVTAVANADNSASANASVSINGTPSPVSISPLTANLEVGGIALFTAKVTGINPSVIWLVENVPGGNDVVGTVSPVPDSPNQVTYLAPLVVPGGGQSAQVHVIAQSVVNPLISASAAVTVSALGSTVVTITNPSVPPTVPAGQTQSFQSNVAGVSDTTVSWEVDAIPGGNANLGTIKTEAKGAAVYTAPENVVNPFQVIVTAVSNAQPAAQASILVNVIPAQKVTVTVTADECTNTDAIPINTSTTFTAQISGLNNQDVTWQVNQITGGNSTVGTITPTGVYTAPATVPAPATVTISAVPVADPLAVGKEPVTISLKAVTKVTLTPTSASVEVDQGQDFTATVAGMGSSGVAVTWNVNNENGGDSIIGTIDPGSSSGCEDTTQYLAPISVPSPPTVTVTAVASDQTVSNGALVTITPPPELTESLMPGPGDPSSVQVGTSNNQVLYTVTQTKLGNDGTNDTTDPISWTLTSVGQDCSVGHGSICGTITPTGINSSQQFTGTYTAPATVPPVSKVTVTVTSVVDPSASDYNDITISNGPPTIAITGPQSIEAGTTPVSFTAVITNANPNDLVWNLGCISDSDSTNQEDFCDSSHTDFGPGCIKSARGIEVCNEQDVTLVPPTLVYTPPKMVSTADYLQNACTLNGDPHASIVPINVQMIANGCPLVDGVPTCTAIACVTITPP